MVKDLLARYYGFSKFWPGQEETIENILKKRDTLALMPTGGGKSLCYQLPALIFKGTTLVISPLIALMKDQVDVLQKRGIKASFINSSLTEKEIAKRTKEILKGSVKILYLAPERLNSGFSKLLHKIPVSLVAIDEAHCVSTWGHDFRPDYRLIKKYIDLLPVRPVISAFTATATPEVKNDIIEQLGLKDPRVFTSGFDRPNLVFFTRPNMTEFSRDKEVLFLAKSLEKPGIIYVGRRDKAENLAEWLTNEGLSTFSYHAGLRNEERTRIQEAFMEDKVSIIVATIAFGMGVDKSNIRFVIHAGMPGTLEGYYQEAGRAGRDGKRSACILLHNPEDGILQNYFIRKSYEESLTRGKPFKEAVLVRKMKKKKLRLMENYVIQKKCRRSIILSYFGDKDAYRVKNCNGCDYCLGLKNKRVLV